MGLVLAIFCFIIGIPMFLAGLGIIGWGAQQYAKALPIDKGEERWLEEARLLYRDRCLEYYGPNGTVYRANPYLYDYRIPGEAQQLEEQKECVDNFMSNAIEVRDKNLNEATTKFVGGGLLALFAFLIMWGGNRSRRPKEVRIRHD